MVNLKVDKSQAVNADNVLHAVLHAMDLMIAVDNITDDDIIIDSIVFKTTNDDLEHRNECLHKFGYYPEKKLCCFGMKIALTKGRSIDTESGTEEHFDNKYIIISDICPFYEQCMTAKVITGRLSTPQAANIINKIAKSLLEGLKVPINIQGAIGG